MGYTLTPIAVDLEKIKAVLGSRDEMLWKQLAKKSREQFDNIDALGDDYDYEEEPDEDERGPITSLKEAMPSILDMVKDMLHAERSDDRDEEAEEGHTEEDRPPCPSMAEALRHLIMGEPCDRRVGFKYGYLLECLCRHFGNELPHDRWYDLRHGSAWFQDLDRLLHEAGVSADVLSIEKHLSERGSPIAIPKYHDFPSIGYLTVVECQRALEALSKARFDDLGEEDEEEDTWLPGPLDDVRSWLQTCVASRQDLVCFYA